MADMGNNSLINNTTTGISSTMVGIEEEEGDGGRGDPEAVCLSEERIKGGAHYGVALAKQRSSDGDGPVSTKEQHLL